MMLPFNNNALVRAQPSSQGAHKQPRFTTSRLASPAIAPPRTARRAHSRARVVASAQQRRQVAAAAAAADADSSAAAATAAAAAAALLNAPMSAAEMHAPAPPPPAAPATAAAPLAAAPPLFAAPPLAPGVPDEAALGIVPYGPEADYDLGELLGSGTFGSVRAATHRSTGAPAAIKALDKRGRGGADRRGDAVREAAYCAAAAAFGHAVALRGVYEDAARVYIVQELCAGGDAAALASAAPDGRLSEAEAAAVGAALLSFLSACHAAGIVYGDVKPGNVLLRKLYPSIEHILDPTAPKGALDIAVGDFGCCRAAPAGGGDVDLPASGTPAYLAPEAFHGRFGQPSDVWAVGVVLYEFLSGALPFWPPAAAAAAAAPPPAPRHAARALRDAITRAAPAFGGAAWREVSPAARDLVERLLEKDPARRVTAAEAAAHPWFAAALGGGGTGQ